MSAAELQEETFGESSCLPKISERRRANQSDSTQVSSRSVSLEAALRHNLVLEHQLESSTEGESPQQPFSVSFRLSQLFQPLPLSPNGNRLLLAPMSTSVKSVQEVLEKF